MKFRKRIFYIFGYAAIFLFIFVSANHIVGASSVDSIEQLYQQGIREGKIDPENYSIRAFRYNYAEGEKIFAQQRPALGANAEFSSWFSATNFAAMPDGSSPDPQIVKPQPRTWLDNAYKFTQDIRKGDILIVDSAGFGHAAIATTDNFVLQMNGGGNIVNWLATGIPNNNQQFLATTWAGKYIENNYVEIWRPKNGVNQEAADFADWKFYSSSHGLTKDRVISYGLLAGPHTFDPNYCSKLVWQAFWYGTGTKNVATGTPEFIAPKSLPEYFTGTYAPYKVGRY